MVFFPWFLKWKRFQFRRLSSLHPFLFFTLFMVFIPVVHPFDEHQIESASSLNPALRWAPKSHDFGYVQEGSLYETTFEIWNNGTGDMPWYLDVVKSWISVSPSSGSSSGEHDVISVTLNTTGLLPGSYEGNIIIHSEGDYIFYTSFIVTETQLAFFPASASFHHVQANTTYHTSFSLWNDGKGIMNWQLTPSTSWISVVPSSGSTMDVPVNVSIDIDASAILDIHPIEYILIDSNGGTGLFTINISMNHPPSAPMIHGPQEGRIKKEQTFTISSFDEEGDRIFYEIQWGDGSHNTTIGPFYSGDVPFIHHTWEQQGNYTIIGRAIDEYGMESNWTHYPLVMSHHLKQWDIPPTLVRYVPWFVRYLFL